MFTGLIEDLGKVAFRQKNENSITLGIESKVITEEMMIGDSIAVDGICLTITRIQNPSTFFVQAITETIQKTTIDKLVVGSKVNIERAIKFGDRLGGHFVQGHVDGKGTISSIEKHGNAVWMTIRILSEFERYIVYKGPIAIDGISLTVAEKTPGYIRIAVIPFTFDNTNLQYKNSGSETNIELDWMAKYIENFLSFKEEEKRYIISEELLREQGYISKTEKKN